MAASEKDTIYVDIDDEITGIIDKVRASDGKIVALVLPKRASVFQSIVNMKLLKRATENDKKHLVLITSEAGLLPLAGAAGIHVAKTLTSKPEIPAEPAGPVDSDETIEEVAPDDMEDFDAETASDKPIGQLAGIGAAEGVETVELDNEEPAEAAAPAATAAAKAPKLKKDKKLAVPNFDRFRKWLIIGGAALVALLLLLFLFSSVFAKATINVQTDAQAINTDSNLNLSTTATSADFSNNTIPAHVAKEQKTFTQQVAATGQQNNGNKATGSVSMSICASSPADMQDVPAGSALSANGLTYITQNDSQFHFAGNCGNSSFKFTDDSVDITAQQGGANYNTGNGTTFKVSGRSDVTASGSAKGGTDNIVTVISQNDINNAKSKISTGDNNMQQTLKNDLSGNNYYPIDATYSTGTPQVTTSGNVGDAANNVTVTENVTYTMFGVQKSDLKTVVDNSVKDQIDTSKQSILSEGLDQANFNVTNQNDTSAQLTMHAVATAGPQIDTNSIKQQVAGKKSGEVQSTLEQNPDVTGVNVKFSPFWVSTVPKNTSKINVVIAKPKAPANNNNANP